MNQHKKTKKIIKGYIEIVVYKCNVRAHYPSK